MPGSFDDHFGGFTFPNHLSVGCHYLFLGASTRPLYFLDLNMLWWGFLVATSPAFGVPPFGHAQFSTLGRVMQGQVQRTLLHEQSAQMDGFGRLLWRWVSQHNGISQWDLCGMQQWPLVSWKFVSLCYLWVLMVCFTTPKLGGCPIHRSWDNRLNENSKPTNIGENHVWIIIILVLWNGPPTNVSISIKAVRCCSIKVNNKAPPKAYSRL
jgi:hypothetical protein